MIYAEDQMPTAQECDRVCPKVQPVYSRQGSVKRSNYEIETETDIEDFPSKRTRTDTEDVISCPLAPFGCLSDVPCDDLKEHYRSLIHNQCIMETVTSLMKKVDMNSHIDQNPSNNDQSNLEILKSLESLAEGLSSLSDDSIVLQKELLKLRHHIQQQENTIEQLKRSIEESNSVVNASQIGMQVLENELESLKRTAMNLSAQSSNDGTFIWKISDVSQKINDAISEKQTSIYSAPFYSSPTGYKMCLRLYMNGDAIAKQNHLSLFIVIMRGEYDAILTWPFSFKITFCLFDQTTNQKHIVDTFRAEPTSNSFQRPKTDMNIASGLPKFCPLPFIQQADSPYVRDDCMFIRCVVDFDSVPKPLISYVCGVNIGLPKRIQEKMIREEIERYKQREQSVDLTDKTKPPNNQSE